ncbi:Succinate dehydrogenase assembly factor 2, partial [Globisporangium splendens]
MAPTKRLNLSSKSKDDESSSASSSDEEERVVSEQEEQSQSEDESDECVQCALLRTEYDDNDCREFEIPPGFEPVKGSASVTRETVLSDDKELWFFKLPKHMDASALANLTFKVGSKGELGDVVAKITRDDKKYQLQHEDVVLTHQLVNALPETTDRKKFSLGKPFSRVFSLIEDRSSGVETKSHKSSKSSKREAPVEEEEHHKSSKKSKSSSKDDAKAAKKAAKAAKKEKN